MTKFMLLLFLTSCISLSHVEPVPRTDVTQARAAVVVELSCSDGGDFTLGRTSLGSGVIISERHVLTAAHVVACPFLPSVWVTLSNGRRLRMAVTDQDDDADIARLEIFSADRFHHVIKPPALALFGYTNGEQSVCAHAAYPRRQRHCGEVRSVSSFAAPTPKGSSGSGVYDRNGRLVGILIQSLEYSDGSPSDTRFAPVDRHWLEGT